MKKIRSLYPWNLSRYAHHLMRLMLLGSLASLAITSCTRQEEPIKIGFLGQFTAGTLELSTQTRNGIDLLLEEVNRQGGIRGRQLELIVANAGEAPESSYEALVAEGVSLVIGPLTSAKCAEVIPAANRLAIPVISPTCSSPAFSDQQDAFFRVCPNTTQNAEILARFTRETLNVQRIAVINDIDNASFTRPWLNVFIETVNSLSGEIVTEATFRASEHPALKPLIEETHQAEPDAILILADPLFTGRLAQHSHQINGDIPILTSAWALTGNLAQYAGNTSEHIFSIQNRDFVPPSRQRELFQTRFKERFNTEPLLAAEFGYEAALVAVEALRKSSASETLNDNLTHLGEVDGLDGVIRMDQCGDAVRRSEIVTFQDGHWNVYTPSK